VIARLQGTLVRDGEQVIVDCRGVGYEVTCSAYTLAALPAHGEPVTLKVYTQMRETAIQLYGFAEHTERRLFDLLITVKNVGPSTAIAILSGAGPREGIGKKTAELLVVELHEKCELEVMTWSADGSPTPVALPAGAKRSASSRHPLLDEVAAALVGMGWRPIEADAAVKDLAIDGDPPPTIETLLRQALRSMPR
jgi:holliday junction DNA helicase RuvA